MSLLVSHGTAASVADQAEALARLRNAIEKQDLVRQENQRTASKSKVRWLWSWLRLRPRR